jgi:N-acyl homoserine lactone hydrolase
VPIYAFAIEHAGGLHHFPRNEILVSRADLKIASGRLGRLRGYPNDHWPSWFAPTVVDLAAVAYGPFPKSLELTQAGDVTIVPLHGHTAGQIGVVVEEGDHSVLLAGDSSYTQDLMLRGVLDGPSPDAAGVRLTHQRIRALAAQTPTVYLVAHDPQTPARLDERRVIEAAALNAAA